MQARTGGQRARTLCLLSPHSIIFYFIYLCYFFGYFSGVPATQARRSGGVKSSRHAASAAANDDDDDSIDSQSRSAHVMTI